MKIALVLLFCLAAATTAQARPLKSFCERFEPLRKVSDLKYIKHRMRVEPSAPGVKVQDVRFTIEAKAGVIRISPNAEGFVELPLTEALCAENPNIEVNQPPGTLSLGISIEPERRFAFPPARARWPLMKEACCAFPSRIRGSPPIRPSS